MVKRTCMSALDYSLPLDPLIFMFKPFDLVKSYFLAIEGECFSRDFKDRVEHWLQEQGITNSDYQQNNSHGGSSDDYSYPYQCFHAEFPIDWNDVAKTIKALTQEALHESFGLNVCGLKLAWYHESPCSISIRRTSGHKKEDFVEEVYTLTERHFSNSNTRIAADRASDYITIKAFSDEQRINAFLAEAVRMPCVEYHSVPSHKPIEYRVDSGFAAERRWQAGNPESYWTYYIGGPQLTGGRLRGALEDREEQRREDLGLPKNLELPIGAAQGQLKSRRRQLTPP